MTAGQQLSVQTRDEEGEGGMEGEEGGVLLKEYEHIWISVETGTFRS